MEHNQNYEFEEREVSKQGTTHILFSHTQELLVPERHPIREVSFKTLKFRKLKVYTVYAVYPFSCECLKCKEFVVSFSTYLVTFLVYYYC